MVPLFSTLPPYSENIVRKPRITRPRDHDQSFLVHLLKFIWGTVSSGHYPFNIGTTSGLNVLVDRDGLWDSRT